MEHLNNFFNRIYDVRNTQLYLRYEKQLKTINIIESESDDKEEESRIPEEVMTFQELEEKFAWEWFLAITPLEYLMKSAEISHNDKTFFVVESILSCPLSERRVIGIATNTDLYADKWMELDNYVKIHVTLSAL